MLELTDEQTKPITIALGDSGEKIILDPAVLRFTEAGHKRYLQEISAWYAYYGRAHGLLERAHAKAEHAATVLQAEKFAEIKESGKTDRMSEMMAKSDVDVISAQDAVSEAKAKMRTLAYFLRAIDMSHESAQNIGNTLRKELDKQLRGAMVEEDGGTVDRALVVYDEPAHIAAEEAPVEKAATKPSRAKTAKQADSSDIESQLAELMCAVGDN